MNLDEYMTLRNDTSYKQHILGIRAEALSGEVLRNLSHGTKGNV